MEKIHKDSCTIRIGNQVLLVANLSLSPIQNKKLEKFIQNLEVKSAASNSFIGLEHLKEQYTSLVTFYHNRRFLILQAGFMFYDPCDN